MVDIGATKTTVCCIEDGVVLPRSVIRKNFGGNDQTELMMRLLRSDNALHYFPKAKEAPELTLSHPYHLKIVEALKHKLATYQMSLSPSAKAVNPLVATKSLPVKRLNPATLIGPDAVQLVDEVTVNVSVAPFISMQALFYSQAMVAVREAMKATDVTIGLEPI